MRQSKWELARDARATRTWAGGGGSKQSQQKHFGAHARGRGREGEGGTGPNKAKHTSRASPDFTAMDDWGLDVIDSFVASPEYTGALRKFVDENCECFVDTKAGAFGLQQNDVFRVGFCVSASLPLCVRARVRRRTMHARISVWVLYRRACAGAPFSALVEAWSYRMHWSCPRGRCCAASPWLPPHWVQNFALAARACEPWPQPFTGAQCGAEFGWGCALPSVCPSPAFGARTRRPTSPWSHVCLRTARSPGWCCPSLSPTVDFVFVR